MVLNSRTIRWVFPISSPLTSGLWADGLSLLLVLGGLVCFASGLVALTRRFFPAATALGPVVLLALGSLGMVGVAVIVMLAGGRGIPVAQGLFILVALVGAVRALPLAWRRKPSVAVRTPLALRLVLILAIAWSAGLWMDVYQDHIAFPSAHDGIAHTNYYLRVLEYGVPTLGRVPLEFPQVFGPDLLRFYPTGTHAFIAISSGFWGQLGLVSQAGILKAWFTLAMAAAPWLLVWFVRRVVPAIPWWIAVAVGLLAIPGFRFPIEAAHEGGASRLFAHVLLIPLYAEAVTGRFCSSMAWRAAAAPILCVTFLMHPSAFVTLAALLAYAELTTAPASWTDRLRRLLILGFAVAISGLLIFALLQWNGIAAEARDAVDPFSWTLLIGRWKELWNALYSSEYGLGLIMWVAMAVGLALMIGRRRALQIPSAWSGCRS